MANWLSGWSQRQKLAISNFSSECQVLLDLSTINWDSIASDGADLRVTDNDGTTLLPIWLEEFDYGAQTGKLWIKLPATYSGDLYLYTGNPSATSASDGNAVFELFDDFEDGVQSWTVVGGTWSENAGVLERTDQNDVRARVKREFSDTGNLIYEYKGKHIGTIGSYPWIGLEIKSPSTDYADYDEGYLFCAYCDGGSTRYNRMIIFRSDAGSLTFLADTDNGGASVPFDTWNDYKITFVDGNLTFWINGVQELSASDSTYTSGSVLRIWADGPDIRGQFDNVRVRKYVSPEPSLTAGAVEWRKTFTETITLTDTAPKKITKAPFVEAISLTDTITKKPKKTLTETISLQDTFSRTWSIFRSLTESITLTDTVAKKPKKILPETISLTDTVAKKSAKTFSEAISLTDAVTKKPAKTLTESISLADAYTATHGYHGIVIGEDALGSGQDGILVRDDQAVRRVEIGNLGTDWGIVVRDNTGKVILSATGLGDDVVDTAQLVADLILTKAIRTATSGERIEIRGDTSPDEIRAYNASNVQTVSIKSDGSGFFGKSADFSWDTTGILSINGVRIKNGTITAAKLDVDYLSAISANIGTCTAGKIRNAANTFYIDLDASKLYCNVAGGIQIDSADGIRLSTGADMRLKYNSTSSALIKFANTGGDYGFNIGCSYPTPQPAKPFDRFEIQAVGTRTGTSGILLKADGVIITCTNGFLDIYYSATIRKFLQLIRQDAEPTTAEGAIAYADGTTWNPGSGEGIYAYYAGAWHYLG